MSHGNNDRLRELEVRLAKLKIEFEHELRARGFEPEQVEHAALPTKLAKMFQEQQLLLSQVEELGMAKAKEQKGTSELDRIADQFRRAFFGQAWHGPSLRELLAGVTAAQAAAYPIIGAHSIWELVLHIGAWERACLLRLEGDPAQLTDAEDWEAVDDTSEEAWDQTKQRVLANHQALINAIETFDESRLDQPVIDDPDGNFSSVYVTLHGGVQHDLYHAGQIAILKKALEGIAS